jgi:hypothetical protein
MLSLGGLVYVQKQYPLPEMRWVKDFLEDSYLRLCAWKFLRKEQTNPRSQNRHICFPQFFPTLGLAVMLSFFFCAITRY